MSLKDLRLPGRSKEECSERRVTRAERSPRYNKDIEVACGIVDDIFDEITLSMKDDHISLLAKGFIQSLVLTQTMQDGVKEFIEGWSDERAKKLMDKIESRIRSREDIIG